MKKLIDRLRQSLTARIFLITAVILFAACGVTYGFIAWATPISYRSIAMDSLNEQAAGLVEKLRETTLEDSGPLFDRFILETGAEVLVTDAAGGSPCPAPLWRVHRPMNAGRAWRPARWRRTAARQAPKNA